MQLTLDGRRFRFDGDLTYADSPAGGESVQGLLMNARFIQGVFDDAADPGRFARFGHATWDAEAQTDRLIAALPAWYRWGLRAFTVGFQGGGPCFTTDNTTIDNNPFGARGDAIEPAYASRMERLIRAADACGMAVIVSFFYGDQASRLADDDAIRNSVITASRWLRDAGYGNVLIEVANEYNVEPFRQHPVLFEPYGVASLIELARTESGGLPVGCSGTGGMMPDAIIDASDVVLVHGNGQTRQAFANLIRRVRDRAPEKPIVCNEDSPAISNLPVAMREGVSWGYYNNWTKQEPPTSWEVLPGMDRFFAWRMAAALGYEPEPISESEQFMLCGLGPHEYANGHRWPILACLFPEAVDRVVFERDGVVIETIYDDPFAIGWRSNWLYRGCPAEEGMHHWEATAVLREGSEVVCKAEAEFA
ncbi:MAG: hypothetical protein AAF663_06965 [Planctomycetota bacterium]